MEADIRLAVRQDHPTQPLALGADVVSAAEVILRGYGPRAVSLLSSARTLDDGRRIVPRLSANDCYVALGDAVRKMARVAARRLGSATFSTPQDYADAIASLFPDPAAYLARCIRSVIADAERVTRRELVPVSLETPIAGGTDGDGSLSLADVMADSDPGRQPESVVVEADERRAFRSALGKALRSIPEHYVAALTRDMARQRERENGVAVAASSARDRQAVCRARSALSQVIARECGEDNPYVRLLTQQRSSRVHSKPQPAAWDVRRQDTLIRRILDQGWAGRAAVQADGSVDEAIVNDVTVAGSVAPPSPEVRSAMRVIDLYTVDKPVPQTEAAQVAYAAARAARQAGRIEEALKGYRHTFDLEPSFIEALNEVGVMHSQLGHLNEALRVYLAIVNMAGAGEHRYIAATNAADIYLTWYDSGRNRDKQIELARHYAEMAMARPTPMRVCNLLLVLAKELYYDDARELLERTVRDDAPRCRAERFLQTLFQIRDADLVAWWNWLEDEMGKEDVR